MTPGQRLPSTRDLSRRFGIHANTASAAYRQLEDEGWVEMRHGSGVFVRATRPDAPLSPEMAIDQMIGDLAAKARKFGASDALLKSRLRRWLALEPPARWLVIEPDPELRRIVICEMEQALSLPVIGCAFEDCATPGMLDGSMPAVLPSKAAAVRKLLPAGKELVTLQVHPVSPELQSYLKRYMPGHSSDLVGIASRWADFQRIAQTMLVAAGFAPGVPAGARRYQAGMETRTRDSGRRRVRCGHRAGAARGTAAHRLSAAQRVGDRRPAQDGKRLL